MTRRLTVLGAALTATLLLSAQAVAGWLDRPTATALTPAAATQPAPAAPGRGAGADRATGTSRPGAVDPGATGPGASGPGSARPGPARPGRPTAGPATSRPPAKRPGRPTSGVFAAGVVTTTKGRGVSLTFDDGPAPGYTPQVLAILRANGVRATFCVVGTQARAHPELIQQIVREGHQLCNHSWNHELNLGRAPASQIRANLRRTNDAIRKAVPGVPIRFFRHPGGNWTPTAIRVVREMRMIPTGWTVDPRDWERPPASRISAAVLAGSRRGSIVLLHDGGGDRRSTVAACRTIVPALKRKLRVVPLS
ncbi:polysaccharide deacetylase family protein [Pilimelia anulata]|uniref:polysaccharide deacetylase family protein n=1 Tax=Pilimelia anulata TaxID=53371 RepID=UPI00166D1ACE|nr:polysaccharide deacetylase family protein [Pilimelia anulata]